MPILFATESVAQEVTHPVGKSIGIPFGKKKRGFTLVEVMIVLIIIGFASTLAVPRFRTRTMKMKAEIRTLSSLSRQLHGLARLQNKTYRIAIKMDEEKGYSYWVESGDQTVLIAEERETMLASEKEEDEDDDEKNKEPSFQVDTSIIGKERFLPDPLIFSEVEVGGLNQEFSAGMAYVYYFPYGLGDDAAIHITDQKDLNWTILIHPLTGQAHIHAKEIRLKEFLN
jgi:prepilin-type N-terminal cleavage/methylation domain-containing protein